MLNHFVFSSCVPGVLPQAQESQPGCTLTAVPRPRGSRVLSPPEPWPPGPRQPGSRASSPPGSRASFPRRPHQNGLCRPTAEHPAPGMLRKPGLLLQLPRPLSECSPRSPSTSVSPVSTSKLRWHLPMTRHQSGGHTCRDLSQSTPFSVPRCGAGPSPSRSAHHTPASGRPGLSPSGTAPAPTRCAQAARSPCASRCPPVPGSTGAGAVPETLPGCLRTRCRHRGAR